MQYAADAQHRPSRLWKTARLLIFCTLSGVAEEALRGGASLSGRTFAWTRSAARVICFGVANSIKHWTELSGRKLFRCFGL